MALGQLEKPMKTFQELYNKTQKNAILTGNGFNLNFGYKSSYKNIFKEMKKLDTGYEDKKFKENLNENYNIEKILGCFKDVFAQKAIKTDFVKALMEIMKNTEKNKNKASIFIKKFNNVFTLNYDPFLYKIGIKLTNKSKFKSHTQYGNDIEKLEKKFKDLPLPNENKFVNFSSNEKASLTAACCPYSKKKTEFHKEAMTYFSTENNNDNHDWRMVDGFQKTKDNFFTWKKTDNQNIFTCMGLYIFTEEKKES